MEILRILDINIFTQRAPNLMFNTIRVTISLDHAMTKKQRPSPSFWRQECFVFLVAYYHRPKPYCDRQIFK